MENILQRLSCNLVLFESRLVEVIICLLLYNFFDCIPDTSEPFHSICEVKLKITSVYSVLKSIDICLMNIIYSFSKKGFLSSHVKIFSRFATTVVKWFMIKIRNFKLHFSSWTFFFSSKFFQNCLFSSFFHV